MTEKELFNSYFKENFRDLHKAICCGDLVAINYKKAMWKSWKASTKREDFILVPLTKEIAVTIERKVEQQLEASGITADPFRLDGWSILDAISAVEVR